MIRLARMFPPVPKFQFGFSARVATLYAAIFMLGGIQLPFLPVWLRAKGLDAATIGLVLATPMVVRVLAIPFAARAADRYDALRAGLIAEIVLFAVSGRLPPFFQPGVLLMVGALGAALRWSAMAFDPPAVWLPWLQLLHALSLI